MTIEKDSRGWWVLTKGHRVGPFSTASKAAAWAALGIG